MKNLLCVLVTVAVFASLMAGPSLARDRDDLAEFVKANRSRLNYAGPVVGVFECNEDGGWSGVLQPKVIPGPGEPDSVCTDKECKQECKSACKKAGHGDKVTNVETTDQGCFATCDDGSGAQCFAMESCPENASSHDAVGDPAKTDGGR